MRQPPYRVRHGLLEVDIDRGQGSLPRLVEQTHGVISAVAASWPV